MEFEIRSEKIYAKDVTFKLYWLYLWHINSLLNYDGIKKMNKYSRNSIQRILIMSMWYHYVGLLYFYYFAEFLMLTSILTISLWPPSLKLNLWTQPFLLSFLR